MPAVDPSASGKILKLPSICSFGRRENILLPTFVTITVGRSIKRSDSFEPSVILRFCRWLFNLPAMKRAYLFSDVHLSGRNKSSGDENEQSKKEVGN